MPRSDAPLIRHLHEQHGSACAHEWQRPPLVVLAGAELIRYLLSPEARIISEHVDLYRLPWEDAVYELGPLREALDDAARGAAWMRIRTLDLYAAELDRSAPWMSGPADLLAPFRREISDYLVVEAWEDHVQVPGQAERSFALYPDVVVMRRDQRSAAYLYPNPSCRGDRVYGVGFCDLAQCRHRMLALPCTDSARLMSLWSGLAPLLLGYLLQVPDYPVEVVPRANSNPKAMRTTRLKPWLRDDLPHTILVDPARVRDYGHPSAAVPETHAAPRPHQRRGHWRRLTAERYGDPRTVWVRPAWVGATEWTHEGNTYRVLMREPLQR